MGNRSAIVHGVYHSCMVAERRSLPRDARDGIPERRDFSVKGKGERRIRRRSLIRDNDGREKKNPMEYQVGEENGGKVINKKVDEEIQKFREARSGAFIKRHVKNEDSQVQIPDGVIDPDYVWRTLDNQGALPKAPAPLLTPGPSTHSPPW